METNTLLLIGIGALALIVIVALLIVLNRSWGNFPDRLGAPPVGPSSPGVSSRPDTAAHPPAQPGLEQAAQERTLTDPPGLVVISHPMIRRAAEQALQRGDRSVKYIVRQGDQFYFSFDAIEDLNERRAAYELMRRFEAGEDIDLRAMMALIRRISSM